MRAVPPTRAEGSAVAPAEARPGPTPDAFAGSETAVPHPEEMRGAIDLAVGGSVRVRATGRATPAGLMALAACFAAVLVPMYLIARTRARAAAGTRVLARGAT